MAETAESVVLRLEAQTTEHDTRVRNSARVVDQSMSQVERAATRAETSVRSSAIIISRSFDTVSQRSRLLGYQISDIGVQLASGTNPFLVLAQQAPQVANALEGTAGVAGRLAAFFSGPWGAALLAAGSVVAVLASSLGDSDEAAKKHEKSAKSLADAIRDMEAATRSATQTSRQSEAQNYREAQSLLEKAKRAREATVALLGQAKARLQAADEQPDGEGGINFGVAAGANQERRIAALNKEIAEQTALIQKQEATVRRAALPILQNLAAEATDKATAATGKYERALGSLNRKYEEGKVGPREYNTALQELNKTRDAEVEAANKSEKSTKGDSEAKRAAAKAAREAAAAQRELEQALDQVVSKFDPARAAANQFNKALADISKLEAAGLLSYVDAIAYKIEAASIQAEALAKRGTDILLGGRPGRVDDPIREANRDYEQMRDKRERDFMEEQRKRKRIEEDRVHDVADLYEDLLTRGTSGVWDTFKQIGARAIAETLARFSLNALGLNGGEQGGGGLSSLFASIGSLFGRASGGYVAPGQMVRVNEGASPGRVEGFRPLGAGHIVPLGQMNAVVPGGNTGGNSTSTVRIMLGEGLKAEFVEMAAGVSLQVFDAKAPGVVNASVNETLRIAGRPRI